MANFKEAVAIILKHEGGYANVSGDNGGETYKGIARNFHPGWKGWAIVDANKPLKKNQIIIDEKLDDIIIEFYKTIYWNPIKCDSINSQRVANFLFDWFIHSGRNGIKRAQSVMRISDDGIVGNQTILTINSYDENTLMVLLKRDRISQLTALSNKPNQAKFLKGWLNRVNSFE